MYTLGKVALTEIPPTQMVGVMFSFSVLILGVWCGITGEWRQFFLCSRRDWINILAFSVTSIAALLSMWSAIAHLDPTVASFIGRLQTLVAVVLGVSFLREKFRAAEFVGGIIVFCGVLIIGYSPDIHLNFWFWIMVGSAVSFGITEFFAKLSVHSLAPVPLNMIRNGIVGLSLVFWNIGQGQAVFPAVRLWYLIPLLAIFGPIGSRICFLYALKYVNVSKAVLVNQMQPLFVAIVAFAFLGTIPTVQEWIGGVLVLGGCVVLIGFRHRVGGGE
jgi:drug/metabolite transporter (DMT)-like permease